MELALWWWMSEGEFSSVRCGGWGRAILGTKVGPKAKRRFREERKHLG